MSPLLAALLLAAAPPSAEQLVERALDAVGGRAALEAQSNLTVHSTLKRDREELVLVDLRGDGVRLEEKRERKTTRVRGRAGRLAWDFKRGAIPPDHLRLAGRLWVPTRLLTDEAKVERVVGAPAGYGRVLLTYPDGEMLYLDIHEKTGRVARLEGFDQEKTVVVRYEGWRRYGDHWLPEKLTVKRQGTRAETHRIKAARFNGPMSPRFFLAPPRGSDL